MVPALVARINRTQRWRAQLGCDEYEQRIDYSSPILLFSLLLIDNCTSGLLQQPSQTIGFPGCSGSGRFSLLSLTCSHSATTVRDRSSNSIDWYLNDLDVQIKVRIDRTGHSLIPLSKRSVDVSKKQFTAVDLGQLWRRKCKFRLARGKNRRRTGRSLTSWVNDVRVWRLRGAIVKFAVGWSWLKQTWAEWFGKR